MDKNTKKSIQQFISSIANKQYASAQTDLQQVVAEKIKNKVRNCVNNTEK